MLANSQTDSTHLRRTARRHQPASPLLLRWPSGIWINTLPPPTKTGQTPRVFNQTAAHSSRASMYARDMLHEKATAHVCGCYHDLVALRVRWRFANVYNSSPQSETEPPCRRNDFLPRSCGNQEAHNGGSRSDSPRRSGCSTRPYAPAVSESARL